MTRDQVLATVIRLVKSEVSPAHAAREVRVEDRLREDLQLDSLQMVTLSISLEDEFGLFFDPLDMDLVEIFATIGSLVDFLYQYMERNV